MTQSTRPDGRSLISVTMAPELYQEVKDRCMEEDKPLTVWVRELIKRELEGRRNDPT